MRIVMTGATAGIGLEAATRLLARGDVEMIVGARRPDALPAALAGRVTALPLDNASLASVAGFADAVRAGPAPDVVLLNAGLQFTRLAPTADGFESTFAINHLAHYVLARRLATHVAPDGRLILTSSGTHDPAKRTGIPAPNHADVTKLAFPDRDPMRDARPGVAGRRAYSSSKLLNVMTARELARRLETVRPDLMIAAFDPGFTPGTGLARDYGAAGAWLFRNVFPLFVRGKRVSTPARSGALLAALATAPSYAQSRGDYWAYERGVLVNEPPSELARDAAACARVWDDSADLAGLPRDD